MRGRLPEFDDYVDRLWVSRGRLVLLVGMAFSLGLIFYDWSLYRDTFRQTAILKSGTIVYLAAVYAITYVKRLEPTARWWAPIVCCVFIVLVDLTFHLQGTQSKPDRVFAYTASTFVIFYLLPMTAYGALWYLGSTFAAYFVYGAAWGHPPAMSFGLPFLTQAGVIVSACAIGNKIILSGKRKEIEAQLALEMRTEQLAEAKVSLEAAFEELKSSQAALARAEGLAAVSELVNGISHEINNPLGSASSLLQSLRDDLAHGRAKGFTAEQFLDAAQTADVVHGEIDRARALITELKELGMDAQRAPAHVDLATILKEVGIAIESKSRLPGSVRIEPVPAVRIRGSYAQLDRVFQHVLANAVDAEKKAGRSPRVSVRASERERDVEVVIEDRGIGIAPEILEKIFQPFFTTRRGEKRPGLGLYLAHEIVRSLGGKIGVESGVGQGTRFSIALPKAA